MSTINHLQSPEPQRSSKIKIPSRHTITSLLGMGPIPFGKITATHALVEEANAHPNAAHEALSHREHTVRAAAVKKAHALKATKLRTLIEPIMKTLKARHGEINQIDKQSETLAGSPIIGIRGEKYTYEGGKQRHNEKRALLAKASDDGSQAHHVKPYSPTRKFSEIASLCMDGVVFLFAMIGILNVNLRLLSTGDFPTVVRFIIAVVFALFATAVLTMALRDFGRRHRQYKNDEGTISTNPGARRVMRGELIFIIAVVALAAGVMAARVVLDALHAGTEWWLTLALAPFLALILAISAYVNYRSEFDNGSPLTDEIRHLSSHLTQREMSLANLSNERQMKVEQAGVYLAKLERSISDIETAAQLLVSDSSAEKAIHTARSYIVGHRTDLPTVDLTYPPFEIAKAQAKSLAEHQQHLENSRPIGDAPTVARQSHTYEEDLFTLFNTTN